MKLVIRLEAAADCSYDNQRANYTFGGRIRNALKKHAPQAYDHESSDPPLWCFTLPEWQEGGYQQGETAYSVVSAYNRDVLEAVSQSLQERPELGLGRMIFDVREGFTESNNVRVGERGKMRTRTGCLVKTEPYEERYWREEDGTNLFRQRVEQNIHQKMLHSGLLERHDYSDEPIRLFESHELTKTFACPKQVAEDHTQTFVFSKWVLEYRVRDRRHRDYLNLALDAGLGAKNAYGFGFLEVMPKYREYTHEDTATRANA